MSYKKWILVAVCLFGIGMAFGLAVPAEIPSLLAEDIAALKQLSTIFGPFQVSTAIFIFLKNVFALLFSFAFSPILCLFPILALTLNGWLLSFVSVAIIEEESFGLLLVGILPHGIIELPALVMGEAAALSSGALVMVALFSKKRRSQLQSGLKRNLRYLALACLLLLPAAVVETYVTPLFLT